MIGAALLVALAAGVSTLGGLFLGAHLALSLTLATLWVHAWSAARWWRHHANRLLHDSGRDSLTGLLNRSGLAERLREIDDGDEPWMALILGVDSLTAVNERFGVRAADELLLVVTRAMSRCAPADAVLARLGGGEFMLLAPGELQHGRRLGVTMQTAASEALAYELPGVDVGTHVGVGRLLPMGLAAEPSPETGDTSDLMNRLGEVVAAAAVAKQLGPDAIEVYEGALQATRERQLLLESRLRSAVANGRIRTVAQPIWDMATAETRGYEALARWRDEELGEISPGEFIPVAEQSDLIIEIGRQVLVRSIEQAAAAGVFAAGRYLSVNASPVQLRRPGLAELVEAQLEIHDLDPQQLVIEVTESVLITDDDPALRTLIDLRALGVRLAIDDFGTGYSAIGYLRQLPVQLLKMDMSLTRSLEAEPRTRDIVLAVQEMATRMGMSVVMEGVETEAQADMCRSLGADLGQGWLHGRPTEWSRVVVESGRTPSVAAPGTIGPEASVQL
ncbi:putative bifunctional diguanylate cyclase/phosphodiesterase [Spongisporangium articulatum]|uniref:Bifunctional diguanylate cyclase/phosphodiesterase n=1 Tax=Spongisporangium articulatum TaxID=3362603 RepID=A0ABW8AJH7_9ACTN